MVRHVLQTDQTRCYDVRGRVIPCNWTGQDGEVRPGVPWPEPRFLAEGSVVEDRLTGLSWPRNATACEWPLPWEEALGWVARRNREVWLGHADWRMPDRREMRSLISHQARDPALPAGHPFGGVFPGHPFRRPCESYWSSTSSAYEPDWCMALHLDRGAVGVGQKKGHSFSVWAVSGMGSDC